ncbi:Rab1a [Hexamita inflata]|uniref:Rab1a n=1 Tax=Hexamita inflata TaxID=28002 RepID=A0ABP1IL27_9EUKA
MEAKVVFLGDAGVGKTCILQRLLRNQFDPQTLSTAGAQFVQKAMNYNGKQIKLNLWDTAGQEKYRSLATMYYRNANAVLIIFDLTRQSSLDNVVYWYKQLQQAGISQNIIIVGNKADSVRKVRRADAELVAESLYCPYFECSAKTGDSIGSIFEKVCELVENCSSKAVKPMKLVQEQKQGCCQ